MMIGGAATKKGGLMMGKTTMAPLASGRRARFAPLPLKFSSKRILLDDKSSWCVATPGRRSQFVQSAKVRHPVCMKQDGMGGRKQNNKREKAIPRTQLGKGSTQQPNAKNIIPNLRHGDQTVKASDEVHDVVHNDAVIEQDIDMVGHEADTLDIARNGVQYGSEKEPETDVVEKEVEDIRHNVVQRGSMIEQAIAISEEVAKIEGIDRNLMARTTRAVVLAGGETNNPLTKYRAMPAVPIGSSMFLVDIPVNNCLKSGINKIYVLTQFQSHVLHSHINASYPPVHFGGRDGQAWVDVLAAQQTTAGKEWHKGSADAVRKNIGELKDETRGVEPAQDYVILSGSGMYNMDLAKVVAEHRVTNADVTICSHLVSRKDAVSKGVMRIDSARRVYSFEEKPSQRYLDETSRDHQAGYLANMGVYVFTREALFDLLDDKKSDVVTHIGHHVIPNALCNGMKVHSYVHNSFWKDISSLRDYYEACLSLTSSEAPIKMFELDGAVSVKGSMLPPSKMLGTVRVSESILGDGTVLVDCTVKRSVVGECIYIGSQSMVEDSLLLGSPVWSSETERNIAINNGERVFGVGKNCILKGCIVDENVSIGDGCILTNVESIQEADCSDKGYMIHDGILVLLRNANLPPGTVI